MSEIVKLIEALQKDNAVNSPGLFFNIDVGVPRYEKYFELIQLMAIPGIKQIILGKMEEVKFIAKEEIKSFFQGK